MQSVDAARLVSGAGRLCASMALVCLLVIPGDLMSGNAIAAGAPRKPSGETSLSRLARSADQLAFQLVELPSGRVIVEQSAHLPLIPASVVKVLTSYAALKWLGPEHRFRTSIWTTARLQGGVLTGPVYLRSDGDPFLVLDKLQGLVRRLRDSGVQRITGSVYVDNSHFAPQTERVCLDDGCDEAYNPTLSGTALEFNSMFLRVKPAGKVGAPALVSWFPPGRYVRLENNSKTIARGSKAPIQVLHHGSEVDGREGIRVSGTIALNDRAVHEHRFSVLRPDVFVSSVLHAAMEEAGIGVDRSPGGAAMVPAGARKLVELESNPLSEICCGLNRYSNNFMAEMLLRDVGAYVFGPPGTEVKGLDVVRRALVELGVSASEVSLKTGSGLSRECRVSAGAFNRVLVAAYADPALRAPFLASMAVAGQEGTLRNRMKGSSLVVRGKTGTLRDVVGFSGYVEAPTGGTFAATVLMNGVRNLPEAKGGIDALLEEVASRTAR